MSGRNGHEGEPAILKRLEAARKPRDLSEPPTTLQLLRDQLADLIRVHVHPNSLYRAMADKATLGVSTPSSIGSVELTITSSIYPHHDLLPRENDKIAYTVDFDDLPHQLVLKDGDGLLVPKNTPPPYLTREAPEEVIQEVREYIAKAADNPQTKFAVPPLVMGG